MSLTADAIILSFSYSIRVNMLSRQLGNVPTCLRANVPKVCQLLVFTCQRANKRAKVPCDVPMFQLCVPTCQKACQFSKNFSYEMLKEISILYYFIKNVILDIIVIHIICIRIVHKNCNVLQFYTSYHIKESCVEFFFFVIFSFLSL